jgi:hypothetical protein
MGKKFFGRAARARFGDVARGYQSQLEPLFAGRERSVIDLRVAAEAEVFGDEEDATTSWTPSSRAHLSALAAKFRARDRAMERAATEVEFE